MPFNTTQYWDNQHTELISIYEQQELTSIEKHIINNSKALGYHHHVTKNKTKKNPFSNHTEEWKYLDDLKFTSNDLLYLTGILFQLQPYIIDTVNTEGTYHQNLYDHRYLTHASFAFHSFNGFLDRLGLLLNLYTKFFSNHRAVTFRKMVYEIKTKPKFSTVSNLSSFVNLLNHYTENIDPYLKIRRDITHNLQLECQYYWSTIQNRNKHELLLKSNLEKKQLPETCKKMLHSLNKTFELTLTLIEQLPDHH